MKQYHVKNWKVVIYSLIALAFIGLAVFVSYWFLIGAVVLVLMNQHELTKSKASKGKNKK